MENKPLVNSRLLLRVAADLQKEMVRQTDAVVQEGLAAQVRGLRELYKEVEAYRTIKRLLNGDTGIFDEVIVEYAPISERYWNKGDVAIIRNGQIRLGGCWFDYDDRYIVKPQDK